MALFGHIETGFALDVWEHPDQTSYEAWARIAAGDDYPSWQIVQLPDGTVHGAKDNGDGTFTNPVIPPPPVSYRKLSRLEFVILCQTAGGMTDANLVAAKADSNLAALWIKLEMAQYVERDNPNTQAGLGGLAQLGYLPNGAQSVIDAWPEQ